MEELKIRYIRLLFTAIMLEDVNLPYQKASMLRGGMGQVLLDVNCIHTPTADCGSCSFEDECIVRRIMYSKPEIQPEYMSGVDSVGYVLECEDHREAFREGETLEFSLLLFGKTIVYLSQFMNAFFMLGRRGIGKEHGHFQIVSVKNSTNEELLTENGLDIALYKIRTIEDYVDGRLRWLKSKMAAGMPDSAALSIYFQSPLCIKYQGCQLASFDIKALFMAVSRRIYILDCNEGIALDQIDTRNWQLPEIYRERHREVRVNRYSERQKSPMTLRGIEGNLLIAMPEEKQLKMLLAGELVHAGKNTSFGFGRYTLKVVNAAD